MGMPGAAPAQTQQIITLPNGQQVILATGAAAGPAGGIQAMAAAGGSLPLQQAAAAQPAAATVPITGTALSTLQTTQPGASATTNLQQQGSGATGLRPGMRLICGGIWHFGNGSDAKSIPRLEMYDQLSQFFNFFVN